MVEGLFSLLFYCESSINQYAVQKTLTKVFGASLLLLDLGCLRYVVLPCHLRMLLRIFMRIKKVYFRGTECGIYLSCYNLFFQFLYYRRRETLRNCCIYAVLRFLERSNNTYIESIMEPCVSKNQRGIFAMWVWLERKSSKRADPMEKSVPDLKVEFMCIYVREKTNNSFKIHVIILRYIRM